MRRQEALAKLHAIAPWLRQKGLTSVALFGSTARDMADADSDIDLLVEFDSRERLGLFEWLTIRDEISGRLGAAVDLVEAGAIKPLVRDNIARDLVPIY